MGKEEQDILELIDQYLLNRIHPDTLERLEYLRKANPEINHMVIQSKRAFHVLQYARVQQLRDKLHQIDSLGETSNQGHQNLWIFLPMILLFSLLGIWIWVAEFWSLSGIAERQFEYAVATDILLRQGNDQDMKNWELAHRAFKEKDFQAVIDLSLPFIKCPDTYIASNARWNILLSRLAMWGPDEDWKGLVRQFEYSSPDPFRSKAKKLLQFFNSPFYQFVIVRLRPSLSLIKPRLI